MRISAVDLQPGDTLNKGDVVAFILPVSLAMIQGLVRGAKIERAAVISFVGKDEALLVIDRIKFDVYRNLRHNDKAQ